MQMPAHCASRKESTYRLNVDLCECLDKLRQSIGVVVDTLEQYRLVAHDNTMLEQVVRCLLRDPRNLTGMVDVRMEADLLPKFSAFLREAYQGFRPIFALDDSTWSHSKTLGGESDALDIFHAKKSNRI
jgi:hypothetical protein